MSAVLLYISITSLNLLSLSNLLFVYSLIEIKYFAIFLITLSLSVSLYYFIIKYNDSIIINLLSIFTYAIPWGVLLYLINIYFLIPYVILVLFFSYYIYKSSISEMTYYKIIPYDTISTKKIKEITHLAILLVVVFVVFHLLYFIDNDFISSEISNIFKSLSNIDIEELDSLEENIINIQKQQYLYIVNGTIAMLFNEIYSLTTETESQKYACLSMIDKAKTNTYKKIEKELEANISNKGTDISSKISMLKEAYYFIVKYYPFIIALYLYLLLSISITAISYISLLFVKIYKAIERK